MSDPRELRLDLPAAHAAVRMARNLVREFALQYMPDPEVETLELVTSELLANAVDHGGGNSAMEEHEALVRMKLFLVVSPTTWELEVADEGGGEPAELEGFLDPDAIPDLEDERGRGFFLMATMVDRMTVRKSDDGAGLVLAAVKRHDGVA